MTTDYHEGIFLTSGVLHPKSRGDIRLQSTNPTDQPLIDPKLLDHRDDLRTLVEGNYYCLLVSYLSMR